jgi:hypothetical protein
MKLLGERSSPGDKDFGYDNTAKACHDARHYIGRLADHIRAPQSILQALRDTSLQNILEEFTVSAIEPTVCIQRPVADSRTNLDSIMARMLERDSPQLGEYQAALRDMDAKFHLTPRILQKYDDANFIPQIHAEIRVLEHFYSHKLNYYNNDRYIGCSKGACYCCHLYFQHHPARCVMPQTSRNIYLNWGLAVVSGEKNEENHQYVLQRDIINNMVKTIRRDAMEQIIERAPAPKRHPDTLTGITESVFLGDITQEKSPLTKLDEMSLRKETLFIS